MAQRTTLSDAEKLEAVLLLLRKQESAAALARRYGISEPTLCRWREDFLEGGKAALTNGKATEAGSWRRVPELERAVTERDRGIGEPAIANRVFKKILSH